MSTEATAWHKLEQQLAQPSAFDRLLEQEAEMEADSFSPMGQLETSCRTAPGHSAPDRWDRAVAANRRYARSLAWQAFRSTIIGLLGFSETLPDDYAFAAAVARWQKSQGNLTVDGIIGPQTLKRMNAALRSAAPSTKQGTFPAASLHKLAVDPEELGRIGRELEQETQGAETFWTEPIAGISDGHTSMTRRFAKSVKGLNAADVEALVAGSAKPDKDLPFRKQVEECQQRRHALRGRVCQEVGDALGDIRGHFAKLYKNALAIAGKPNFGLIGEALHLIQDSYSPAHTEREHVMGPPYLGAIVYIRVWNPISPGSPTEHGFPADLRDRLDFRSPQGVAASTATREFLEMVVRHIKNPKAAGNRAQFMAFMNRHLGLSSANQTIAAIIRMATSTFDPDPRYAAYVRCLAPDRAKTC